MWQGEIAGDRDQRAGVLVRTGQRDRPEQRLRIGVLHFVEHILDAAPLNRLTGIHHADAVTGFQDQPKVVTDEQHRGAVFFTEVFDEFDHRSLHRHVERGGRFVEDQKCGLRHQRHGDDDALLLPAGKLVRIAFQHPFGVGQFHVADHFEGALIRLFLTDAFMDHRHFHQLAADLHGGVEGGHRLLIDHRDFRPADFPQAFGRHGVHFLALELDRPADDAAVHAQILHDAQRHGGFAAAALAHQPKRFARHDGGREIHHGGDFAQAGEEGNGQLVDFEDRLLCHRIHSSADALGRGKSNTSRDIVFICFCQ